MKHILSQSAYLVVNKEIARVVGLNATVLLADLISKEGYFTERKGLVDGMFFNTYKNIQLDTTLTEGKQKTAIQMLRDKGLITTRLMGMPAKTHFKIHENKILEILNLCSVKKDELVTGKTSPNKNKEIRINNNISYRYDDFSEEVFRTENPTDMCTEFISYWTEPNKSKTKMRFELQKTFDITRRINTWIKNDKKWERPTGGSKIDKQLNSYNEAMDIVKNIKYED